MNRSFSYDEYLELIRNIKNSKKYQDYADVSDDTGEFILMRHDVEFSVERAYKMAVIEAENDFFSSYFFQLTNNSYNLFSQKNIDYVKDIIKLGHKVGLHFHSNGLTNIDDIKMQIRKEIQLLSELLDYEIDRFSFHRPQRNLISDVFNIPNYINVYDKSFFSFVESESELAQTEVKYYADSMHKWKYGYPSLQNIKDNRKVQILVHPYSWTEAGYDNLNNFRTMIQEKNNELIETIDNECNHFEEIKNAL